MAKIARLKQFALFVANDLAHKALSVMTVLGLTVLLLSRTGCPSPGGGTPTTNPVVQQVETVASVCLEPAIVKIVTQIIPEVVLDLVSGDFSAILTHLIATLSQQGVTDALTAVTCAVANIHLNAAHAPPGSALSPVVEHAAVWLKANPLSVADGGVAK